MALDIYNVVNNLYIIYRHGNGTFLGLTDLETSDTLLSSLLGILRLRSEPASLDSFLGLLILELLPVRFFLQLCKPRPFDRGISNTFASYSSYVKGDSGGWDSVTLGGK